MVVVVVVVDVVLDSVGQGEHMLAQGQQAACSNILTKNILFYFYKALFSVEKKGGRGGKVLNSCKKRGYMVKLGRWGGGRGGTDKYNMYSPIYFAHTVVLLTAI